MQLSGSGLWLLLRRLPSPCQGRRVQGQLLKCQVGRLALKPASFRDPTAIREHSSTYLQELRESPKADGQERIYTHGEKEIAAIADRKANGIPVNDNTMVEVLDLCSYLGMDFGAYFGDYRPPVKEDVFKGNY